MIDQVAVLVSVTAVNSKNVRDTHFHLAFDCTFTSHAFPPCNAHANAQALARVPNVPTHTCVPYFLCRPSVSITVFFNISIVKNPFGLQSDSPLAVAADATVAPGQSTHRLIHYISASLPVGA